MQTTDTADLSSSSPPINNSLPSSFSTPLSPIESSSTRIRFLPFEPHLFSRSRKSRWTPLFSILSLGLSLDEMNECPFPTLTALLTSAIHEFGAHYGYIGRYSTLPNDKTTPTLKLLSFSTHTTIATTDMAKEFKNKTPCYIPLDRGRLTTPFKTGKPYIANHFPNQPIFDNLPGKWPIINNLLCIPMLLGGECIGMISFANSLNGVWSRQDASDAMVFGSMLATFLLLLESSQSKHCDSETSSDGQQMMDTNPNIDQLLFLRCDSDLAHFVPSFDSILSSQQLNAPSLSSVKQQNKSLPLSSPATDRMDRRSRISSRTRRQSSGGFDFVHNRAIFSMGLAMVPIFESLSDAIVVFDEKMHLVACNPASAKMLGFRDTFELKLTYPRFDNVVQPICRYRTNNTNDEKSQKKEWQLDLNNLLALTQTTTNRIHLEVFLNKKGAPKNQKTSNVQTNVDRQFSDEQIGYTASHDSKDTECAAVMTLTSFMHEEIPHFSAVFRDLTQDKVYQEKDTLLAFLSHEIRNPVQAITLACQLLNDLATSQKWGDSPIELVKDIISAADLLHSVVTDTIDYVQISSRNFHPKWEVC
jgi:PAS domain-containing protein